MQPIKYEAGMLVLRKIRDSPIYKISMLLDTTALVKFRNVEMGLNLSEIEPLWLQVGDMLENVQVPGTEPLWVRGVKYNTDHEDYRVAVQHENGEEMDVFIGTIIHRELQQWSK